MLIPVDKIGKRDDLKIEVLNLTIQKVGGGIGEDCKGILKRALRSRQILTAHGTTCPCAVITVILALLNGFVN